MSNAVTPSPMRQDIEKTGPSHSIPGPDVVEVTPAAGEEQRGWQTVWRADGQEKP